MKKFPIKTRPLVDRVIINVSIPTSANKMTTLFAPRPKLGASKRPRLVTSKSYATWLTECSFLVAPTVGRVDGLLSIELIIHGGSSWSYARDLDNTLKPTLDMLQKLKIIANDNTKVIRKISQLFVPCDGNSYMTVVVKRMSGEEIQSIERDALKAIE